MPDAKPRIDSIDLVRGAVMIHALATFACGLAYGSIRWMLESPDFAHYPFSPPPGWGFPLQAVYLMWIAVVVTAYPLCRWFAVVRARRQSAWLSYL